LPITDQRTTRKFRAEDAEGAKTRRLLSLASLFLIEER
jgi:hypothetical protein